MLTNCVDRGDGRGSIVVSEMRTVTNDRAAKSVLEVSISGHQLLREALRSERLYFRSPERNLSTEGFGQTVEPIRDEQSKRVSLNRVVLPSAFPEKYRGAIERAVDHCAVKKHILEPPRLEFKLAAGGVREQA